MNLSDNALSQILDLFEKHCGAHCEVVLHDLSKPYDKTVVDIRNGHITGRKIGDCGSNLGLEVMRMTSPEKGDAFNYISHTREGKILRSSSIYLRDDKGNLRYSLCVNLDITDSMKFESYLKEINRYEASDSNPNEIFVDNVQNLLGELITRGAEQIGKKPCAMNKEEKIELLRYLDNKGALLISKSGERICEELQISKFTFYNYLESIRKAEEAPAVPSEP